jgi:RNA polymerase sigma-70 factor (ECF subfamily)
MESGAETILNGHSAALILFARQWVPSHADAEDAVQEAFVRFWRSRDRVLEPTAFLYACVKRCALEFRRSHQRRLRREEATARPEAEPLFEAPAEQLDRAVEIEKSLVGLPEKQREVLVMKIWGGLSFREIGDALAIPEQTAASRFRYALTKLHEALAEETVQ